MFGSCLGLRYYSGLVGVLDVEQSRDSLSCWGPLTLDTHLTLQMQ